MKRKHKIGNFKIFWNSDNIQYLVECREADIFIHWWRGPYHYNLFGNVSGNIYKLILKLELKQTF